MNEKMSDNFEAQAKLFAALSKAQAQVGAAHKKRTGQIGQQKYKYADLAAIDEAIGTALVDNGLAIVPLPGQHINGMQGATIYITHEGGGWIREEASIPCKSDSQGAVSGSTYLRRTILVNILLLVTEDDDGAGAMPNKRDTPMVAAAREMTGTAPSTPSAASRPSSEATGAFNLGQLKTAAAAAKLSPGILGAYMSGSKMPTAPTPEMLHDWLQSHDGFSVEGLLGQAAFYFAENGGKDDLVAQAKAYLETAEAA